MRWKTDTHITQSKHKGVAFSWYPLIDIFQRVLLSLRWISLKLYSFYWQIRHFHSKQDHTIIYAEADNKEAKSDDINTVVLTRIHWVLHAKITWIQSTETSKVVVDSSRPEWERPWLLYLSWEHSIYIRWSFWQYHVGYQFHI